MANISLLGLQLNPKPIDPEIKVMAFIQYRELDLHIIVHASTDVRKFSNKKIFKKFIEYDE